MKYILPIAIVAMAAILIFAYSTSRSISIGMTKHDVIEALDPDNALYDPAEFEVDTVAIAVPNAWFGGNPEASFKLIFKSDTLVSFEKHDHIN